jgi:hypothetical protein
MDRLGALAAADQAETQQARAEEDKRSRLGDRGSRLKGEEFRET